MSRLTKRIDNEVVVYTLGKYEDTTAGEMESSDVRTVLRALANYEDKEEQGSLIELPCKVGDTVYYVHREYHAEHKKWLNYIDEVTVDSFTFNTSLFVNVSLYIGCERFGKSLTPYKTLFFTRSEAEEALARMKGE